ncbi:MAG: nucleotide exchange factor GrpE [Lapillicoccus sp.]
MTHEGDPSGEPHGPDEARDHEGSTAHDPAGRSGQGSHGGDASSEPGGEDEFDAAIESEFFNADSPNTEAQNDGVTRESAGDPAPPVVANVDYLEDLRRLQAEYVNYKRRVDRDRDVAREQGVGQVVVSLLPVLDDIHLARQHGDLEGTPFASIADKLDGILGRFGVTQLGAAGEEFDPAVHEALMHVEAELPEGATATTVVQVLQPGYKVGERVVRPARVSVADPQ